MVMASSAARRGTEVSRASEAARKVRMDSSRFGNRQSQQLTTGSDWMPRLKASADFHRQAVEFRHNRLVDRRHLVDLERAADAVAGEVFECGVDNQFVRAGRPGLLRTEEPGSLLMGHADLPLHALAGGIVD